MNYINTRKDMLELLETTILQMNDTYKGDNDYQLMLNKMKILIGYFFSDSSGCTSCNFAANKIKLTNFWNETGKKELNELNNVL